MRNPSVFPPIPLFEDIHGLARGGSGPAVPFAGLLKDWSSQIEDRRTDPPEDAWPLTHEDSEIVSRAVMCRAILARLNQRYEDGTLDELWNPPQAKGKGAPQQTRTPALAQLTSEVRDVLDKAQKAVGVIAAVQESCRFSICLL